MLVVYLFTDYKSIHNEAVSNVRENLQHLDVNIFTHILSSRTEMRIIDQEVDNKLFYDIKSCHTLSYEYLGTEHPKTGEGFRFINKNTKDSILAPIKKTENKDGKVLCNI